MKNDFVRLDPVSVVLEGNRSKKAAQMQRLAQECRVDVLDVLHDKGTGHWGGASSCAELVTALYFHMMDVRPEEPQWPGRDRVIVSKGHASCMIYSVMARRGYFPREELDTFRQINSRMQGHPCMNKTPGIEMSTGALGHGISVAAGMALAARLQKRKSWTYVIVGDGCLDEGQSWEGIMTAAKFKPERLVMLVDYNKVQLDGPSAEIMPMDPLPDKFRAFNWNVAPEIYDGHSVASILQSWDWLLAQSDWPAVIIYKTVKGRGVSYMENNHKWHGPPIDDTTYATARPELLKTLSELEVAQ